jgi:taurine dioxygenase
MSAITDPAATIAPRRVRLEPFRTVVGPATHLAKERTRLGTLRYDGFTLTRLSPTIGAIIEGVDLTSALSDQQIAEIHRCLLDFKVIFFRNQPLTAEQHASFARRFGDLEVHPFIPSNTGQPELVRFEKEAQVGGFENGWHSDVSWREIPSAAAVLHAIEVPEVGGDTAFCDMYAAYDGLDEDVKDRIEGLSAIHDFTKAFGHTLDAEAKASMRELYPPVTHRVVRTHEETGKRLIYVNRYFTQQIVGLEESESNELIDLLCSQADIAEYQCRFRWEADSVAFWDNRAVQHLATSDYWPERRVMERASIVGSRPQ